MSTLVRVVVTPSQNMTMKRMIMSEKQFFYGNDDENFPYEGIGELIDAIQSDRDIEVGDTFYVHEFRRVEADDLFDVDTILDRAECRLDDIVGENYDDQLCRSVTKTAQENLHKFLEEWFKANVPYEKYWIPIGKSTEMKFTAEDLE